MSRRSGLILTFVLFSSLAQADDRAIWNEYGLLHSSTATQGKATITQYHVKDPTGALAAWEWLRSPQGKNCDLAPFCTADQGQTVVSDFNYVLVYAGARPAKAEVAAAFSALPDKRDSALPAILTFLPRQGLVPDSARYILGPASLAQFAPELSSLKPGFDSGAEAQVAEYRVGNNQQNAKLVLFDYPTPEMARLQTPRFRSVPKARVKRSGVLVAAVLGAPSDEVADTLLSRVEYEGKITWNDVPPPSPIKPLYQLLLNIMYLSLVLTGVCLAAGLFYAGMRLYRRRYGNLESHEAMTTLHLTGD